MLKKIKSFIEKETVLCIAALCAVVTMFLVPPDAEYLHYIDWRVLCLLLCLMAVIGGLKSIGTFQWLTYQLLHRIRSGRILSITLVLLPFFCSMLVTNDVALIIFIPFTLLLLEQLNCKNCIIPVSVMQTIAANLGSMATPVGNPQNLYLYAFYNLSIGEFFSVVLPLAGISLLVLTAASVTLMPRSLPQQHLQDQRIEKKSFLFIYIGLFILCLLTVFRVIPYPITTAITVITLLFMDRKALKDIDFLLLLTFVCFFIVSENLGRMEVVRGFLQKLLQTSPLLTAAGTSQVISNVPAAIILSDFTDQWKYLLAGVNIGGLGTPIASLASLITLKFYMTRTDANIVKFLGYFTVANIAGLIILILCAFAIL